jgi:phosphohistidine phosphatase
MTVRTLILLRHAKAADPDDYATDIERPLTARGHRDATAAGEWLRAQDLAPDAVLCSPAVRTRETLSDLSLKSDVSAAFEPRIYEGPAQDTLDHIQTVGVVVV